MADVGGVGVVAPRYRIEEQKVAAAAALDASTGANIAGGIFGAVGYGIASIFTDDPRKLNAASGLGAGLDAMAGAHFLNRNPAFDSSGARETQHGAPIERAATEMRLEVAAQPSAVSAGVDPQLDANVLMGLANGNAAAIAYAKANRAAGLSYNVSARLEFLAKGTRAQLRVLEQQYGIKLIRDLRLSDIQATAGRFVRAFTDGRTLGYWDAQVAASAYLKGERFGTADLQFYKRARDLGLNVDYVGTGKAAQKAAQYIPQPP
jgi:predicted nucleic acid-binding protein